MNDDMADTAFGNAADKCIKPGFGVHIIDADPAFDRHWPAFGSILHGVQAIAHQFGLGHQAGTETPRLHTIRRAADIEVIFSIAVRGGKTHGLSQTRRITAAQLQGDGIITAIAMMATQQLLTVTVDDRIGSDHFRIQHRRRRQHAVEDTAMPVGPVHHRRDSKPVSRVERRFCLVYRHGQIIITAAR